MRFLKRTLCACLGLCLALCLTACEKQEEPAPSSSAPVSSVASEVSSQPEAESSHFVPAPDLIPSSSTVGETDPFEEEFSQNPIDKKYDADYSLASSFSMMRQACNEAASRWESMVETAFTGALEVLSEEEQAALLEAQDKWRVKVADDIAAIREENGDSNEGILTSSKQIVLLYRERAKELCRIKYDADGTLPIFPDPDDEVSAVG